MQCGQAGFKLVKSEPRETKYLKKRDEASAVQQQLSPPKQTLAAIRNLAMKHKI